jgi:hypothetical protein
MVSTPRIYNVEFHVSRAVLNKVLHGSIIEKVSATVTPYTCTPEVCG